MRFFSIKNMKYFKYIFDGINALGITTTTEAGNMAYQVGNDFDNVKNNREELYKELGIDRYQVVYVHQSHSDIIQEATRQDGFRGGEDFASGVPADALYTKEKDLALAIFHADCVPIIFYDSTVPLIGVIHSG